MKLLPSSSTDRCGLLNGLYNDENKDLLYNIPENAISVGFYGTIQSLINCNVDSQWPSNVSTPYFEIKLYQVAIKPRYLSIGRRVNCAYPAQAVLEAFYNSKWNSVCNVDSINFDSTSTVIRNCKSDSFYSHFRFRQIKNSHACEYIELGSFDIFGDILYINEINKQTLKSCGRKTFSFSLVFVLMSV